MKQVTKQQVVEKEERIHIRTILATQPVQRCANKLVKRGKEEKRVRERGRGRESAQKSKGENVTSLCNIGIYIYFSASIYSYAIVKRRDAATFESKI
jgi:hypothetical protein